MFPRSQAPPSRGTWPWSANRRSRSGRHGVARWLPGLTSAQCRAEPGVGFGRELLVDCGAVGRGAVAATRPRSRASLPTSSPPPRFVPSPASDPQPISFPVWCLLAFESRPGALPLLLPSAHSGSRTFSISDQWPPGLLCTPGTFGGEGHCLSPREGPWASRHQSPEGTGRGSVAGSSLGSSLAGQCSDPGQGLSAD